MMLTCAYYNDADKDVERALQHDLAEEAARKSQAIEAANMVIESWVLRNGGRILNEDGTKGSFEIPAEYLEDLPDIVKQVEEACGSRFHVGIGSEPSEAISALKVAEKRGKTTLYTPDIAEEAEEESSEDPLEMSDMSKNQFNDPGQKGEATRVAEGSLSPMHAAPSAPESAASFAGGRPQDGEQPQPGAAQNEDQVINAIGAVLQDMKAQIPFFEQQVKPSNPQAYQAVMGLVEAMIELAKQVTGGGADQEHPEGQGQPPPQEGQPEVDKGAEPTKKHEGDGKGRRTLNSNGFEKGTCYRCSKQLHHDPTKNAYVADDGWAVSGGSMGFRETAEYGFHPQCVPQSWYDAAKGYAPDFRASPADLAAFAPVDVGSKTSMVRPSQEGADPMDTVDVTPPGLMRAHSKSEKTEGCANCGSSNGYDRTHIRCLDCRKPYRKSEKTELEPPQRLAKPTKKEEVDPARLETGSAEESEEHSLPPGGKKLTGKDIARDHLKEDPKYYAKGETGEKAHQYPVGTHKGGRVKVVEPSSGQTSWHSARAGQKLSGDGHAISARLGECPTAPTPQNPNPGQGGPTQEARDPTMSDAGKR
jgi:hypothetical protein